MLRLLASPAGGIMNSAHRSVEALAVGLSNRLPERSHMPIHDDATIKRFWAKVDIRGPDECWPWKAGRLKKGYGVFNAGAERSTRAHVVSYEITTESSGKPCVLHSCDNPPCCNPKHLWRGTQTENIADRTQKGRSSRGEGRPGAKLTRDIVHRIRERVAAGESQVGIARELGVDPSTISRTVSRHKWSWLS